MLAFDIQAKFEEFVTPEMMASVVRVATVLVIGVPLLILLSWLASRMTKKRFAAHTGMLVRKGVFYFGTIIIILTALHQMGFQLAALLGAAGIAGIALGFAAQTSVSNVISGIFLIGERPFAVGDLIKVEDTTGFVTTIDLMSVKVRTFDNKFIRLPNEMLIKSNAVDVIVVDSVAALVPQKELEGEIGDSHVGLQARLMSQSMRKLTGAISKSKTSVIFINQIREKIGVMFGSPETTPGGRALKFYSSCRIDVRRIGAIKEGDEVIGQRVKARVVKNKVAPPFRAAEFEMMHRDGISYEGDILDLAMGHKLVTRSGAWFRYGDVQLGQGREKVREYLRENPKVVEELRLKVLVALGLADEKGKGK